MELQPVQYPKHTYKCLILGDSGVGKTMFLRRHATGKFKTQHIPTRGVNIYKLKMETNYHSVTLELWDVTGDKRSGGLSNGYFFFAHCAIIMFDLGSALSAISVARWQRQLYGICGNQLPVVICGNKADGQRMSHSLMYRYQSNCDYCELSVLAAWNIELPLKILCQRLLHLNDLRLISLPQIKPCPHHEFDVDAMEEQLDLVHGQMLPSKSDGDENDFEQFDPDLAIIFNEY